MTMMSGNTPSETAPPTPEGFQTRPPKPETNDTAGIKDWKWDAAMGVWTPVFTNGDPQDGPGGPKAAPPDPYAPIMRSFFSAYFKIWGTLPPPGYVEGAARSMNLYEFIDQERKKPAYRHTKAYKNEAAKYAALRDQLLGYY